MSEIATTLCAMLSINAMGFITSILVIRAHSYQLAHDKITHQYGSEGVNCRVVNFYGNLVLGGNFRKFSLIANVTDNLGTIVDLNETMHVTPISTINHESNVLMLLLVHY